MSRIALLAALLLTGGPAAAQPPVAATLPYPSVEIATSAGRIVVELDRPRAPLTVENFLRYVLDGHYDGTVFHRVVPGFVIQGGGYDDGGELRPTREPVVNESGNGLSNVRGTIAMARTEDPHSATAQWYINLDDANKRLDPRIDPLRARWGYTVFGRVVEGMDVVDRIGEVETGTHEGVPDVPLEPPVILSMRVIDREASQ